MQLEVGMITDRKIYFQANEVVIYNGNILKMAAREVSGYDAPHD